MIYFAKGRDLNRVLQHRLERDDAFEADECYVVFPYMKNRHTFGLLETRDLILSEKHIRTVVLNPSRYLFLGLHTCFPNNRGTRVFSTIQEAASMFSSDTEQGHFLFGFLHTRFNPKCEINERPLRSGIFIVSENTDYQTLANTSGAFETFEVLDRGGRFAQASEPMSWHDYADTSVVRALSEIPEDPEQLETQKQTAVVSRSQKQASQGFYVSGGMHILENSTGYLATKPGTDEVFPFANFVIRIDTGLWFPDSEEIYFAGWIIVSGQPVPFVISNSQMHQPKAILWQAQRAVNRSGIPNLSMPTVTEPAHQRKLVNILAQQIGKKPTLTGVQVLVIIGLIRRQEEPTTPTVRIGLPTRCQHQRHGSLHPHRQSAIARDA